MGGTVSYPFGRGGVQFQGSDPLQSLRQMTESINRMNRGMIDCNIFITLQPGSATTTVLDARFSIQTCLAAMPTTANAAAQIPTMWFVCTNGQVVIHHTSNAQTDRSYTVAILG